MHSALLLAVLILGEILHAEILPLPPRPAGAPGGAELARRWQPLSLTERERGISFQILSGNVPEFLRRLCPVSVTHTVAGRTDTASFEVTPDYLAVGSDGDYLLVPLSPNTAQRLADTLNCSLPTRKMVDAIYAAAAVKLTPAPIPPSAAMVTVQVFSQHQALVQAQRAAQLDAHPLGALVAGHQKDVVLSAQLASTPGRVAIYGWHQTNGTPIQPLYFGHAASWVDYSQCIRLVSRRVWVNGEAKTLNEVLADPTLAVLLSDEGVMREPHYPTNELPTSASSVRPPVPPPGDPTGVAGANPAPETPRWIPDADERSASWSFGRGITIRVNAPATNPPPEQRIRLILYALPNGNTTDQTVGKRMSPGEDWHFDLQHIGAQTRFLRRLMPDQTVVVAYLENDLKSWPAWRKKNGDSALPGVLTAIERLFAGRHIEVVLSGHSGGGSFIFGYLNAATGLPENVVRVAFLDSNYAYDRSLGHAEKIGRWLKTSPEHSLCVLAYDDAVALLDGKPFVSAAGSTWGKSHEMLRDWATEFQFPSRTNGGFEDYSALNGRVRFVLKENPEREIFHTVQVERNGFIHALVTGTPLEDRGYEYFGARAYSEWIR